MLEDFTYSEIEDIIKKNYFDVKEELEQFAAMIDKTLETLEKRKEAGTEKISVVQKGDKK